MFFVYGFLKSLWEKIEVEEKKKNPRKKKKKKKKKTQRKAKYHNLLFCWLGALCPNTGFYGKTKLKLTR